MKTSYIRYKQSDIAFATAGNGEKILCCFHGFGETGRSFTHLTRELGKIYTIIALDLPFHGETRWNEGLLMQPADLTSILDLIFASHNIMPEKNQRYSLLGYSLGGRIALQLMQMAPEKVEKLVLIAPDGLVMNFWYWLGTQTTTGNSLFSYTMHKPQWFFSLVSAASKAGLVNKSITKFIHQYIDDPQARINLYKRWTTLRKFRPDLKKIRKIILRQKIPVHFLFGSYDRIILHKRSTPFLKDTENVQITVIEAGHHLLREKYANHITRLFSQ